MVLKLLLALTFVAHVVNSAVLRKVPAATTCGYESCHPLKEGFINVHLVPHTHDDVGWLKTVDQYYYGSNSSIQRAGVQYILDSVVEELGKDATRRFIYVETAFFWKWWIQQHDIVKARVRRFVNSGQLEFIGGAWSMNDEAAAHYHSIIDQFTWGLRKLNDSFGECGRPKIGWQIDPFGHSREMASIFAQLGFDGLLLGRIDFEDKELRFSTKTPEMIWQGSQNLGDNANLFTGVMYNTYGPPPGFCFDLMCNDEQLVDDKKSPLYNIERRVDDFFKYVDNMTQVYSTNNLIITMGEDFHYQSANAWFKNLDKLIYYANLRQQNGSKYNLIYSTPSCYVKAVHDEEADKKWPVKDDDFFPYSSDQHSFWTGYFTSRPTLKRFEREGNNYLQICKQLYSLVDLGPEDRVDLNILREAMGVMQHHDAVTGTEKQHVAEDYARILQKGFDECHIVTTTALSQLVQKLDPAPEIPFSSCLLTNTSSCPPSETQDSFVVTVYNPLSRPVTKHIRLPVSGEAYSVQDSQGLNLVVQIIPTADAILAIPGRESSSKLELIFEAADIPPLGFKSYYVSKTNGDMVTKPDTNTSKNIKAGLVEFSLDPNTGFLREATMNGKSIRINQEFLYYKGFIGNNENASNRSSGAYIFRPEGAAVSVADKVDFQIFRGQLVSEVHQVFNEWASQIIRVFNTENYIEFDWIIGPIPNNETNGKEVITRFTSPLKTNSIFYTDSNGRELLKRVRNFRPTWKLELDEPISGNYYPVTSKIVMVDEDDDVEVSVLTDRAQGGTSLHDGEVEVMIHRNCLHDDAFGVGEALNETAFGKGLVARGSHYLVLGPLKTSGDGPSTAAQERDIAQRKLLSTWTFISPTNNKTFIDYKKNYVMEYSGLSRALPNNVQILTLEPWKGFSFILRLEHVLEKGEDPILSEPATVDLKGLFNSFDITSIRETTLAANQWIEDNTRLHFEPGQKLDDESGIGKSDSETVWNKNIHKEKIRRLNSTKRATVIDARDYLDSLVITLTPMQIRTFIFEIQKKSN